MSPEDMAHATSGSIARILPGHTTRKATNGFGYTVAMQDGPGWMWYHVGKAFGFAS